MRIESAVELINSVIYKPDWKFTATDHSNRFEGTICVRIDYPARNSNRDQAPDYPEEIMTYATFPMIVADCNDIEVYRKLINYLIELESHEVREFFRVSPTNWAPFHPHRLDGMRRWGTPEQDLKFGIA